MNKLLILGCTEETEYLVRHLCSVSGIRELCIASKDKDKCNEVKKSILEETSSKIGANIRITTAMVDVTNKERTMLMVKILSPELIVNMTPPEFSHNVLDVALEIGANYIDFGLDKCEGELLSKQFEYFGKFREKNLTAIVGCTFDPALVTTFVKHALIERFDTISSVNVIDIDERERMKEKKVPVDDTTTAYYLENGMKTEVNVIKSGREYDLHDYGKRILHIMNDPIVDDFMKEIPEVPNIRYLTTIDEDVPDFSSDMEAAGFGALLSKEPVEFEGMKIVPYDFVKSVLKESLLARQSEKAGEDSTSYIAFVMTGEKDNKRKSRVYHFGTAGKADPKGYVSTITLFSGIRLIMSGKWKKPGVFTPNFFDSELLVTELKRAGLKYVGEDIDPIE